MIFNSSNDIKCDIVDKISEHMIYCISNNQVIDRNNIISLIRTYLHELKIRKFINKYDVDKLDGNILINFEYNNESNNINIDLYNQLRKLKIKKICKNIDSNFVIL